MNKKDLLQFCRYYKGEASNPYDGKDQDKAMLWDYERFWIEQNFSESGRNILADYLDEYASIGLSLFEMRDDTPATLKALLFNRYAKSAYSMADAVDGFKKFYQKYYK